ncbi:DUF4810 domain-containing protein [Campylobacter sp.]|uniref:DUF4810 domain-containing protein n=1 Tax=Campylobacter sp. TaxID=205 RepID=UPI0026FCEFA9|nr:DUF4810 domain-containing protein [Campylobacter sp.]
MKIYKILSVALSALFFAGCVESSSPRNMYYWNGAYEDAMYQYLNEEGDIYESIDELEEILEYASQKNIKIPPGMLAHLGLLYSNIGNDHKAQMYLDKEAEIFPESKSYIEFLKNQKNRSKAKKGAKNAK